MALIIVMFHFSAKAVVPKKEKVEPEVDSRLAKKQPLKAKTIYDFLQNISSSTTGLSKLSIELVNAHFNLIPNSDNNLRRVDTIEQLTEFIKDGFPKCSFENFGSFKLGLHLPYSDLDFNIITGDYLDRQGQIEFLEKVKEYVENKSKYVNIELVKAVVPVLKFIDRVTHIDIDVVCNGLGTENTEKCAKLINKHKYFRPVFMVIKRLLFSRQLNNNKTGGISSYMLMHMVFHVFERFYRKERKTEEKEIVGKLFYMFFKLFGRKFDYRTKGITLFKEVTKERDDDNLMIINFQDGSDIGKKITKIAVVKKLFKDKYEELEEHLESGEPILEKLFLKVLIE